VPSFLVGAIVQNGEPSVQLAPHRIDNPGGRFELELRPESPPPVLLRILAPGSRLEHPLPALRDGRTDVGTLHLPDGTTVTGVVRGPDGPVAGATVTLGEPRVVGTSGATSARYLPSLVAETADDGSFRLESITPGDWRLQAERPGLGLAWLVIPVPEAGLAGIELTLQRSGSIAGQVQGAGGEALTMMHLLVYRDLTSLNVMTDWTGNFSVADLAPGAYRVRYQEGWVPSREHGKVIRMTRGRTVLVREGEEARADFPGYDPCRLHGRILGWPGEELGRWSILRLTGEELSLATSIHQDGTYEFPDVIPGRYVLAPHPELFRQVVQVPEQPEHRLDIQLATEAVTGTVVDGDGRLAPNAQVELAWQDGGVPRSRTVMTGAAGGFRFQGVAPGEYGLTASRDDAVGTAAVTVADASPAPVTLTLAATGSLTVMVVDGATGLPVAGARVAAVATGRGLVPREGVEAEGPVVLQGLPAGEVKIVAAAPGHGMGAAVVRLPEADRCTVTLAPAGGRLRVEVQRQGEPVAALVAFRAPAGGLLAGIAGESLLVARDCGKDGLLTSPTLPAGPVVVLVQPRHSARELRLEAVVPAGEPPVVVRCELSPED
jgi:hypothetical protein